MQQLSKILKSRDEWKAKAKQRCTEMWEMRKVHKYYKERVANLVEENRVLKGKLEASLANTPVKKNDLVVQKQDIRALLVFLVVEGVISYRSVIRVLEIFQSNNFIKVDWIPHFSSIINWTYRIGKGLLDGVTKIDKKWIAIADHSIEIGRKQVFVVLRVELDIYLQRDGAITLRDCECIGVKISPKVTGESVAKELEEIFTKSGDPVAIIKDNGSALNSGVEIYKEQHNSNIKTVDDITHIVANGLKKQFEKTKQYQTYMKMLRDGATKLRQTDLAFLIPPKLRKKGRFQAISKLNNWSKKLIDKNIFSKRGKAKKGSLLERLRIAFPNFKSLEPFIKNFIKTTDVTNKIMQLLKNEGLSIATYNQSMEQLKELPKNSKTRKTIRVWLEKHIEIQKELTPNPLPISSDIIESLFGKFKYSLKRSAQSDMNRATLLIPLLCGDLDKQKILDVLANTKHKELKKWEEKNIPDTVRKQRMAFFNNDIQIMEMSMVA